MERRPGVTVPFDGVPLAAQRDWFEEVAQLGYTDVWSSEAGGTDAFTPLALASTWTPTLRLGTAIVPAYTRGAGTMAMCVASMAEAAPGRFAFGIGTSSDVIVQNWNSIPFDKPYARVRDMIRFLRAALTGEKVTEEYETFAVRGFRLGRGDVLRPMWDQWKAGDRKAAVASIPDQVVDDLIVHGSPAACRAHVGRYVESGVTTPALAILPLSGRAEDARQALRDLSPRADG